MEKEESKSHIHKIKNKKKDVIAAEKPIEKVVTKETDSEEQIGNESSGKKETSSPIVEGSENNNNLINKILFRIQLLLSMTNKIDVKLLSLLSQFLSQDHLKCVLEERDCREICGNLLCGNKLAKKQTQSYLYNSISKEFNKEILIDFFCDVRCFQKFKDVSVITQRFDYFRLLNLENIFLFSILYQYYPTNKYLDEISSFACTIVNREEKLRKKHSELFPRYKEKFDKYFMEKKEELENENSKTNNEMEIGIDTIFEKIELSR